MRHAFRKNGNATTFGIVGTVMMRIIAHFVNRTSSNAQKMINASRPTGAATNIRTVRMEVTNLTALTMIRVAFRWDMETHASTPILKRSLPMLRIDARTRLWVQRSARKLPMTRTTHTLICRVDTYSSRRAWPTSRTAPRLWWLVTPRQTTNTDNRPTITFTLFINHPVPKGSCVVWVAAAYRWANSVIRWVESSRSVC